MFIVQEIMRHRDVLESFGEYLIQLAFSFGKYDPDSKPIDATQTGEQYEGLRRNLAGVVTQQPQPAIKRLQLLNVVAHAMLHVQRHMDHDKMLEVNPKTTADDALEQENMVVTLLEHVMPTLVAVAGCRGHPKATSTHADIEIVLRRLSGERVIADWKSLLNTAIMADTDDFTSFEALQAAHADKTEKKQETERIIMPARHGHPGDSEAQWHELPAANGLYMKRVHGYPLAAAALPPGGYPVRGGGESPTSSPPLRAAILMIPQAKR